MLDIQLKVPLGGLPQRVHIAGDDPKKPVLLFLHGGPGAPNRHSIFTKHRDLLDTFILVGWDQRGVGGSFWGSDPRKLSLQRMVDDAGELVAWLCEKLRKEKIFVIGGSWGSALGVGLAYAHPERIAALIGFGQVVNGAENERLSWEFTLEKARAAGDAKDIAALEKVGPPVNGIYKNGTRGMITQRNLLEKYGGYSPNPQKGNYFTSLARPMIKSGEYSVADLFGLPLGALMTGWAKRFVDEIADADLLALCPALQVPYFIYHGVLDFNTPAPLVGPFFERIHAPRKELHWFEHSGHNPMNDEPERFKALLRGKCLEVLA
jgi:pimeloyl-ACP methyl ester carboxylesterase